MDNATDALRLIAGGGIDLVMCEINLSSEGSGVDVARAARDADAVWQVAAASALEGQLHTRYRQPAIVCPLDEREGRIDERTSQGI